MSFALETVLRTSIVLTIGFAVLAALRHRPAALRHWLMVATIGLAAAQPAMNRLVPAWNIVGFNAAPPSANEVANITTQTEFDLPIGTTTVEPASVRFDWFAFA